MPALTSSPFFNQELLVRLIDVATTVNSPITDTSIAGTRRLLSLLLANEHKATSRSQYLLLNELLLERSGALGTAAAALPLDQLCVEISCPHLRVHYADAETVRLTGVARFIFVIVLVVVLIPV